MDLTLARNGRGLFLLLILHGVAVFLFFLLAHRSQSFWHGCCPGLVQQVKDWANWIGRMCGGHKGPCLAALGMALLLTPPILYTLAVLYCTLHGDMWQQLWLALAGVCSGVVVGGPAHSLLVWPIFEASSTGQGPLGRHVKAA